MNVSIIIVNYNTFHLTCDCIDSILIKTKGVDYEIILVDNASAECSPKLFIDKYPGLKLVESKVNLGFAGGNNLGIKEARGDYILLLNSDTVLKNNAVKISFDRLSSSPCVGVLSCKLLYTDERIQPVAGKFPSIRTELKNLLRLNKGLTQEERADLFLGTEFDYQTERQVDWVWGAFFMFPKKILEGFPDHVLPPDYFMYMEDVLWCYRITQMGYQIWYSPQAEVYHLMAGSSREETFNEFDRYSKKILPNEYHFIRAVKGFWYAKLYYFTKALHHLSLRTKSDLVKSRAFFSLVLK